ncbi:MAG: universal stress protein [Desulfobulbaceae bacterium]|nr:universal stress protein [Desulfobulbaceae bacterium]MBS4001310.1 universal stress protein [Desulfobulbaceae bacterium]
MIKRILLPLDDSEYSKKALELAIWLAKHHDAELTGMVILDVPGIKHSFGSIPLGATYYTKLLSDSRLATAKERINGLIQSFNTECEKHSVRYANYKIEGVPSDAILDASKYYDVMIVGKRTFFEFDSEGTDGQSFEKLLDYSITPVIAVPKELNLEKHTKEARKYLIMFDASIPSCRALQRFAQMAATGNIELKLFMSHDDEDYRNHELNQAKELLNAHGFEKVTTEGSDIDIKKLFTPEEMKNYDGVVLGSHSKSTIATFFTGSFTRYVIENSKRVVFVGQ